MPRLHDNGIFHTGVGPLSNKINKLVKDPLVALPFSVFVLKTMATKKKKKLVLSCLCLFSKKSKKLKILENK